MQFDDYQKATRLTAIYPKDQAITYLALGLASEAGEVAGKIKKVIRDKNGDFDDVTNAAIADEVADVLWYTARLLDEMGLSFNDAAVANIDKLMNRKSRGVLQGSGDAR